MQWSVCVQCFWTTSMSGSRIPIYQHQRDGSHRRSRSISLNRPELVAPRTRSVPPVRPLRSTVSLLRTIPTPSEDQITARIGTFEVRLPYCPKSLGLFCLASSASPGSPRQVSKSSSRLLPFILSITSSSTSHSSSTAGWTSLIL